MGTKPNPLPLSYSFCPHSAIVLGSSDNEVCLYPHSELFSLSKLPASKALKREAPTANALLKSSNHALMLSLGGQSFGCLGVGHVLGPALQAPSIP